MNIIEPGVTVEFVMEGSAELQEVLETISTQYCNYSTGIIWNFCNGTNANLSTNDMVRIAHAVRKHARHNRTAYIGSKDLEFGLLRMYEAYADLEQVAPLMRVFREREAALQWIQGPIPETEAEQI